MTAYIYIYIYIIYIYILFIIIDICNALENSLENATDEVLEKFIHKNLDAVKLELYSLQLYWKMTPALAFFQDKMQLSILVLYIC